MDKKLEQKDNKTHFLDDKKGLTDAKVFEEINKLDLNKISNKET